ncbi:MAG: VWA domain-containing protein [Terriglobia bacterium]
MGSRKSRVTWLVLTLAGSAFLTATWCIPAANGGQQSGPAQQPGETVIVPKHKGQQEPAPQPGETVTPPAQNPEERSPNTPEQNKPEKINPKQVYTLSTSTNLVDVNVLVEDSSGDPIKNLQRSNFRLYDNGVQKDISNFGPIQAPLTVSLLVEFSNEYWPLLYQALEEAYTFINVMKPGDWVAAVSFDMQPHILTDFTQNRQEVESALNQLQFPTFSEDNLYDALAYLINRMSHIQGRKAIVAICSGYDTFSKLNYDQMLKISKASATPIYPVSILEWLAVRQQGGYSIDYWQARNGLDYIAKYSGGEAYFPRFEGELPGIYQQIAAQLRTEYSLGFSPTDPGNSGKYHKLKVELVDGQGNPLRIVNEKGKQVKYKLVYRDGYYGPKG